MQIRYQSYLCSFIMHSVLLSLCIGSHCCVTTGRLLLWFWPATGLGTACPLSVSVVSPQVSTQVNASTGGCLSRWGPVIHWLLVQNASHLHSKIHYKIPGKGHSTRSDPEGRAQGKHSREESRERMDGQVEWQVFHSNKSGWKIFLLSPCK